QAEDGIRDKLVTGVQTCALPILVFALATGLRLARFNTMLEVEKPKWQSDYFTGMPAPAGAIAVLLPLYLDGLGLFDVRSWPWLRSEERRVGKECRAGGGARR